ncbi:hypothetical protein EUTSA_v10024294mg [Eutrema salsugineum]|uniref:NB-ARC domain-containing protein n=1 Tax=Eutrema salsugineum TaxID=72664 RepID=V4LXQ6_EUTSA|nr:hypothetical protein EUTSA_v10024294mg [Eutrema salsugineum]
MDHARLRQEYKDERLCMKILDRMRGDSPERVLLTGKSGIGKTRLARKVGEHAIKDPLDRLLADDLVKALKDKITAELIRRKTQAVEKVRALKVERTTKTSSAVVPYILLILDDEGNPTSEDKVMKELGLGSFLKDYAPLKILITRGKRYENATRSEGETESSATDKPQDTEFQGDKVMKELGLGSFLKDYAPLKILITRGKGYENATRSEGETESSATDKPQDTEFQGDNMSDLFEYLIKNDASELLNSLEKAWKIDEPLISRMARRTSLPAAIVVLAKSLNCITRQNTFKSLSSKQEKVLKDVLSPIEPADSVSQYDPILQLAYQLLETDDPSKNAIIDCFWHSLTFLSTAAAYNDGHDILLELINRGFLKIQEGDMVVPEMAMNNITDLRHHGLLGRSRLRFARVDGGDKIKGLGKIIQIDDMIKTVQAKKRDNIFTILVSGNRLRREVPQKFFEQMTDLKVLALFDPTVEGLTGYLKDLIQLRVLVIRNCDLLSDIEELRSLQWLQVLEISGASSLETISDDFFASMSELQSLNLSGLRIKHLPSSISQLKNLQSLILRDCPVLEHLPDIQELEKLEVVDVRGSHNLKTCFGERFDTRRNQTFSRLRQLQLLDFSKSKIKRLPMFHAVADMLHSLTRLSLHNCSNLTKLPNLKPLSGLQILDLSGTTSLVDIATVCFEQKEELKILNLSGTKLTELPSTIFVLSNLSQILLRGSSNLKAIPNVEGLTSLEVFDVSGCTELHTIEGSFKDMFYLHKVNLSGTRIKTLPELPEKSIICCSKLLVLADSRRLEHATWSQVKEAIENRMPEDLSSSGTSGEIQEISRKESGRTGKKDLNEAWAFDSQLYKGHIYRDIYTNTIPFVDTKSHQEILEIHGSNGVDQDEENLAKAEFVAFVDNNVASLSSIFNDLKSVKGCWLEMCSDIKTLFSDVDEESLGNLEALSITNFRWLDSIFSRGLTNLKKLSLDCCPTIITLFPDSAPPSLEVLKIKFCVKLEKVFEEEDEFPSLHTLTVKRLSTVRIYEKTMESRRTKIELLSILSLNPCL